MHPVLEQCHAVTRQCSEVGIDTRFCLEPVCGGKGSTLGSVQAVLIPPLSNIADPCPQLRETTAQVVSGPSCYLDASDTRSTSTGAQATPGHVCFLHVENCS